jgi:SAM-dependent methyltransferase
MTTTPSDDNTYLLDAESPVELARLINQDQMMTQAMGGPLAEQSAATLLPMQHVLDVGCGPGGWVLDVAFAYPDIEVCGVDISKIMIDYANARTRSQGLKNASFGVMNITKPLDFADASFDLVNARALCGVLRRDDWRPFIAECTRILRPGGIFRLTEPVDCGVTTSPAFEQMQAQWFQMYTRGSYGFSPDGKGFGITPVLPRLLRQAGYHDIQYKAHALEFSTGTPAWANFYRNMDVACQLGQGVAVKMGIASREEWERAYQQMLIEMNAEGFCGIWHFTTFWGAKP